VSTSANVATPPAAPIRDEPIDCEGTPRATRFRWVVCGLLFLATTINYMDRQVIGVLKPELVHHLGWTERDYGNIVTSFQFAYAFGYLLAGRAMDLIGVRWGLGLAVLFWSLFACGHAAARSVLGFCVARFGLGLAEGGNFPASIKAISEWFPQRQRALATGLFNAGSSIGPLVTPVVAPWIAVHYGWQAAFVAVGALGFVWMVAWFLM
jgi:ACS family hexuronate transporter-like MFS transporter